MLRRCIVAVLTAAVFLFLSGFSAHAAPSSPSSSPELVWWVWLIILFLFTFFLGIVAVVTGVGGGALFVPIVSSFFPFHLDFVRGAGLLVALSGALSASPGLLKLGLANLKLALPMALVASIFSILGAVVGLALPTYVIQITLGIAIIAVVIIMISAKRSEYPEVSAPDPLSQALRIYGVYHEQSIDKDITWKIQRTPLGLLLFVVIGFLAGLFGIGAGWAIVPVFNLVLGAPLKLSVATSVFVLSINTTAAWVYLNSGAVLPLIAVPSIAGMMLGTRVGVRILAKARTKVLKTVVICFLCLAGLRALLKGLGIWN